MINSSYFIKYQFLIHIEFCGSLKSIIKKLCFESSLSRITTNSKLQSKIFFQSLCHNFASKKGSKSARVARFILSESKELLKKSLKNQSANEEKISYSKKTIGLTKID